MTANVVTIAQKLRAAGRLLEEASELLSASGDAEERAMKEMLYGEAMLVNSLWGDFAGRAGAEYVQWIKDGAKPSVVTMAGVIFAGVMSVPALEWERLSDNTNYPYWREVDHLVLLRRTLDGVGYRPETAMGGGC
jgi:hypothetical protein